ncbi:MAG: NAD(P)H-binding protein [Oxalobacter sp.]|nr:NAD(P)H-binding protein [Oxalobacter sp.]
MKALVIGATGATGRDLVGKLLEDDAFQTVEIFVRRSVDWTYPKLRVHVIDFSQPESWQSLVAGDVLFSCLGTTLKTAGSKAAQWKIDYDYQLDFAKVAAANQVPDYVLVSSIGASAESKVFYSRMKGMLDDAVQTLSFKRIFIFRPPSLIRKGSTRWVEKVSVKLLKVLNAFGLMKSYRPLETEKLAQAMIDAVKSDRAGIQVITSDGIQAMVNRHTVRNP